MNPDPLELAPCGECPAGLCDDCARCRPTLVVVPPRLTVDAGWLLVAVVAGLVVGVVVGRVTG